MGGIKRMNVVWREGGLLFGLVDWEGVWVVVDAHIVDQRLDDLVSRLRAVVLHARQPQRGDPADWVLFLDDRTCDPLQPSFDFMRLKNQNELKFLNKIQKTHKIDFFDFLPE